VVHLGRLKAPRKAADQMNLLTVPSSDGADIKVRQAEEALSASSIDRSGPNDTSKADWSQMASARNPWRHAEPATGPIRGAAFDI
jgi:hypothetical protein